MSDSYAALMAARDAYGLVSYEAGKRGDPDAGQVERAAVRHEAELLVVRAVVEALDAGIAASDVALKPWPQMAAAARARLDALMADDKLGSKPHSAS